MKTRLFVSGPLINGEVRALEGDRARYLGRVLRSRVGDMLSVFDGEGDEHEATIRRIGKDVVTVEIGVRTPSQTESPLTLHLAQGISRGERMDFVIQKATELGVKRITPVLTEFGMVRLDPRRADKRLAHWQQVAVSACEQCGRTRLPLIDPPTGLKAWLGNRPVDVDVDLILKPGAQEALAGIPRPGVKVCVLIGPEGGFSDKEYEDAQVAGFRAVSMGPRILRTETAAVAAVSLLQSRWGDLA